MENIFKRLKESFLKCGAVTKKGKPQPILRSKVEINQNKADYKQRFSNHWTKLSCQSSQWKVVLQEITPGFSSETVI